MEKQIQSDSFGTIQFFNKEKGYGFIRSEQLGDLYFSNRSLMDKGIQNGDKVCFLTLVPKKQQGKLEATLVRKVYHSRDRALVYNRVRSHLHTGVAELLTEIIGEIECNNREFIQEQIDFDRILGKKTLVPINEHDKVVYAVRKGRKGYTKFVMDRQPEDCSSVSIILKKTDSGSYLIITAFVGELNEPEPWDEKATDASLIFWQRHGLVFGSEEIESETLTDCCPWNFKMTA